MKNNRFRLIYTYLSTSGTLALAWGSSGESKRKDT